MGRPLESVTEAGIGTKNDSTRIVSSLRSAAFDFGAGVGRGRTEPAFAGGRLITRGRGDGSGVGVGLIRPDWEYVLSRTTHNRIMKRNLLICRDQLHIGCVD